MKFNSLLFSFIFVVAGCFQLRAQSIGCDSIRVVHAEMDSVEQGVLHLHVAVSGQGLYLNYPQIVCVMNAAGDTLGTGELRYYIHLGGMEQVYSVTTSLAEVPDTLRVYFGAVEGMCELGYKRKTEK